MTRRLTTCYAYPWALITWNGRTPGHAPSTRLAFITETIARQGEVVGYRVYHQPSDGRIETDRWTSTLRTVDCDRIVRTWRHPPSSQAIRQAKLRLKRKYA